MFLGSKDVSAADFFTQGAQKSVNTRGTAIKLVTFFFLCPQVQIAAAAAMGIFGTAAATVGLSGVEGHTLLSPASLLAALMVCTSAGERCGLQHLEQPVPLRKQVELELDNILTIAMIENHVYECQLVQDHQLLWVC